jgi:hypothetical protein
MQHCMLLIDSTDVANAFGLQAFDGPMKLLLLQDVDLGTISGVA